ncbi:MAG: hypothetical protein ACK58T_30280, partial [Phycisphaerae bacterium]
SQISLRISNRKRCTDCVNVTGHSARWAGGYLKIPICANELQPFLRACFCSGLYFNIFDRLNSVGALLTCH